MIVEQQSKKAQHVTF